MPILTTADYPAIRAAIDLSLDANALPDTVISFPQFEPAAENEVLAREALVPVIDPTLQAAHRKTAAILLTAARLVTALPNITGEALGDYKVSLQPVDLLQRAATLRGQAGRELAAYLNTGGQVTVLPAAWLARGGRAL